ncbi:hypothetical protein B0H14DRAFT_3472424 [Mycena olivaceomarginata]|nr:hypothetical protein B0H14DRAFT_3472424 [Mycena olivaceomarginata]
MTALDEDDSIDPAVLQRISNLHLEDGSSPVASPPRTPPRRSAVSRTTVFSIADSTVYEVESPTRRGLTTEWFDLSPFMSALPLMVLRSIAGTATQGIPGGHVRAIQRPTPKKKKRVTAAAYAVFCGRMCGVFNTWEDTEPLVTGVRNNIFRGYPTVTQARAAFAYAEARSWTRVCDADVTPIPTLPQPLLAGDIDNPLHVSETLDDRWYIVYRGICPGVYHTHLECQLNALGVPAALHESVVGKAAAFSKYAAAVRRGDTSVVAPVYSEIDSGDPFL